MDLCQARKQQQQRQQNIDKSTYIFLKIIKREYEDQISEPALEVYPADLTLTDNETEKEPQKTVSVQPDATGT